MLRSDCFNTLTKENVYPAGMEDVALNPVLLLKAITVERSQGWSCYFQDCLVCWWP